MKEPEVPRIACTAGILLQLHESIHIKNMEHFMNCEPRKNLGRRLRG